MQYQFHICDVFTDRPFGGNPLAVLPDARGLSSEQMQTIAREFNFSESSFVLPAERGHTRKVRIFTPTMEMPFAGHPNVGTAFTLAVRGELDGLDEVVFEEIAGPVPIRIRRAAGRVESCELMAPEAFRRGRTGDVGAVARALGVATDDVLSAAHPPQEASVGFPFLMIELRDRDALAKARIDPVGYDRLRATGVCPGLHLYVRSADEFDVRTRMFAPLDGVPEDPATGSANCALAGLLADCQPERDGEFQWRIAQGVEMGRPSTLFARARKTDGVVDATWIGGSAAMVAEGRIDVR